MSNINSLDDLQPGDIMFGPIGGIVGAGVGLGQLLLGESFRAGRTSIRHVGIVVEASVPPYGRSVAPYPPRLVQAMPGGAEEVEMNEGHWTDRHAYVRLMPDYPGQADDAAAIARLMVKEGVAYSPASYAALALWRFGVKTPRLEAWIGRRRPAVDWHPPSQRGQVGINRIQLPVEAICSVLADQAWTLAGKRVMVGVKAQVVTPGAMANQLWRRPGAIWGFPGDPR